MRIGLMTLFLIGLLQAAWGAPPATEGAIQSLLTGARAAAMDSQCERQSDSLVRVLCRGEIRIGVRDDYPHFGQTRPAALGVARTGYEIDIARAIADRLGVLPILISVAPSSRIATVITGDVDILVATTGHTRLRESQIRFIRPHYYRSQTVVVGDSGIKIANWDAIKGRTICVAIGGSNTAALSERGARLLIFNDPRQLLDALRSDTCTLAAHDDSFFSQSFSDPEFASKFDVKLTFDHLPWGIATAQSDDLAKLLDLLSVAWHADGRFLEMAARNQVDQAFLREERLTWLNPGCIDPDGGPRQACLEPAADTTMPPTRFAPRIEALEAWLQDHLGLRVQLAMLKTNTAYSLFLGGIVYSLILVAGAIASTLGFAVLFGAALCARPPVIRLAARGLTTVLQCSPLVLLMFFAYQVASTLIAYSASVALTLAILMIGVYNGSYASHAIAETYAGLRAKSSAGAPPLRLAIRGAAVQIMSFLVNATKGSAVASMIGVPELLNALTDITSFTSERTMTYSVLLAFYGTLVMLVVWLIGLLRHRLEATGAVA